MKLFNVKQFSIALVSFFGLFMLLSLNGCFVSKSVSAKTGVQLWSENCQRCHNTPSPSTFSHEQWETVGLHMQSRALLTEDEKNKIIKFLQQ